MPATRFWTAFGSPELAGLIGRALDQNADLAAAAARVDAARGQLGIARAALLPTGGLSPGLSDTKTDNSGGGRFAYSDAFASLNASWDADLFGRLHAAKRADRARLFASRFDRSALALATEADVSRAYIEWLALGARADLLRRALDIAHQRQRIIDVRVREGEVTRLDAGINATETRQLEVRLSETLQAQVARRDALAVLVGAEAPGFAPLPGQLLALAAPKPELDPPARLLARRPDVLAAEARIAAAKGDVDAARAAFLPDLSLSASALGQAETLAGPLGATLSAGAGLVLPLLDRGRLRSELAVASAGQREAVAHYRGVVLNALREVEDARAALGQASSRAATLDQALAQANDTARLARIQYADGTADLETLLEAERGVIDIEDQRLTARQELLEAAVALFAAAGGDPTGEASVR